MAPPPPRQLQKHLLLTVGATASFPALVLLLSQPPLLQDLLRRDFTHLHIQTGVPIPSPTTATTPWHTTLQTALSQHASTLTTEIFPHKPSLHGDMLLCTPHPGVRARGLVLAHAGTGTVLDAWRVGVPIIVYPNPGLLDNHQDELAGEIERQGYGIRGDLGNPIGDLERMDELLLRNEARWQPHRVLPSEPVLWDHAAALLESGAREEDMNLD